MQVVVYTQLSVYNCALPCRLGRELIIRRDEGEFIVLQNHLSTVCQDQNGSNRWEKHVPPLLPEPIAVIECAC